MTSPRKLKVLAAVVTYNRRPLLERCVTHLQQQTFEVDILIVNNSSTDDTEAYLQNENINYLTQPNSGSAGGWWRCIQEGIGGGYDYVWLMDDDGYPDSKALELLLLGVNDSIACISSAVVMENKPESFVFGYPKLNKRNLPVFFSWTRKYFTFSELPEESKEYHPFAVLFNGALINLKAVKSIGNVDKDYFLYGDEVDYFFRMRKWGKVITSFNAIHYHPNVNMRVIEKNRVYYFIRNTLILNRKYFDKIFIRNIGTVAVTVLRIYQRNGLANAFSYLVGKNAKYLYNGIGDGLKNKKGKRY